MVAIASISLTQNPGTCYRELKKPQFLPVPRSSLSLFSAVVTEQKRLRNLLRKMVLSFHSLKVHSSHGLGAPG